jgi:glycosyltransferase involved in cell wall biosynthesis
MNKISMLLPVYNEGRLLRRSLENTMRYVDEAIIVDGSPWGASTDETADIIDDFDRLYPGKINYSSGRFVLPSGAWDESAHRNLALSKVTGNILMPHCGDMIYTNEGMARMVDAVDRFRDKKVYYCLFIEFWKDTEQIRLYGGHAMEAWYPVPAISDIPMMSMDIVEKYQDGPHLVIKELQQPDYLFVPGAFRYHYGWILGFDTQVAKHIRNMSMGAWGEHGEAIVASGEAGIAKWAINHVLGYAKEPCGFDYSGELPFPERISYLDRYDETIAFYESKYGEGFWHEQEQAA